LTLQFIHQNCNPELAKDRTLPYSAYLVEYESEGEISYDIVNSQKKVEIFDYYWDKYREGLKSFKQTEGRVNPKLWGEKPKEAKKKK
jgi:hypothetical protein